MLARFLTLAALLAALLLGGGCGPAPQSAPWRWTADGERINPELRGRIVIDGSSTVYPITEVAASRFNRLYPNVNVVVGTSGTGGGFKRFTRGEIDISDASRPIRADEYQAARAQGVEFVELPIAYDGLTIAVHPDNDWVDRITIDELRTIFSADIAARRWSDVRSEWPSTEIKIFAPGTDSGTFDYFLEVVGGKEGTLRSDMSTSEDDNVLVTGIAGSPGGLGFFGVAYYEENRNKLRAVPVVNPETGEALLPSRENIESGRYAPLSRPLFIYIQASSLRRPEMKRFVEYFLANAPEMAIHTGYVPLPEEIYQRGLRLFRERLVGTHYLDAQGHHREGPVAEIYTDRYLLDGESR